MEKRGKKLEKLRTILEFLMAGDELSARYRDDALKGEWNGYRDAHIEPDWLMIYQVADGELRLARTGTHADLFDM